MLEVWIDSEMQIYNNNNNNNQTKYYQSPPPHVPPPFAHATEVKRFERWL